MQFYSIHQWNFCFKKQNCTLIRNSKLTNCISHLWDDTLHAAIVEGQSLCMWQWMASSLLLLMWMEMLQPYLSVLTNPFGFCGLFSCALCSSVPCRGSRVMEASQQCPVWCVPVTLRTRWDATPAHWPWKSTLPQATERSDHRCFRKTWPLGKMVVWGLGFLGLLPHWLTRVFPSTILC